MRIYPQSPSTCDLPRVLINLPASMLLMVGILALGLIANLAAVAAAIIRGLGGRPYQGPGPGP